MVAVAPDPIGCIETTMAPPTEDYPGPTKSHPEKEDTNDPPRPANVDPERPPLPHKGKSPSREKGEEK
jgi:hypothetical protein